MARTKIQKKEVFSKVEAIAKDAKSIVFVNFKGMKVADSTAMRRQLRKSGVGFFVAKKTIAKKAIDAKKYVGEMPVLDGEVGIAFSADLITPAREVHSFGKGKKEAFPVILGGVFDGHFKNKEEMMAIALIPDLNTLRSMFVNVINSPIQGLVLALDAIAKKKA